MATPRNAEMTKRSRIGIRSWSMRCLSFMADYDCRNAAPRRERGPAYAGGGPELFPVLIANKIRRCISKSKRIILRNGPSPISCAAPGSGSRRREKMKLIQIMLAFLWKRSYNKTYKNVRLCPPSQIGNGVCSTTDPKNRVEWHQEAIHAIFLCPGETSRVVHSCSSFQSKEFPDGNRNCQVV